MLFNPQIPLHRLVLSLSEALDHFDESLRDHQRRVAYIASNIARVMAFDNDDLFDVFVAAALHDIGLIGVENRLAATTEENLESVGWHTNIGAELLRGHRLLARASEPVRHHHVSWRDGAGTENLGRPVPMASHIIALADALERRIDRRAHILLQADALKASIVRESGSRFHPDVVSAFVEISAPAAFWLDTVNSRIYGVLLGQVDWPNISVDAISLIPLARIFARVVDAASPWTALHSAGVAATATALASYMDFSPREVSMMQAAGFLHDIGKVTVPSAVLNKREALDDADLPFIHAHTYHTYRILDSIGGMPQVNEWASFHHERLDGTGYPFGHKGRDLTLGSRIMCVADVFTAMIENRPYRCGVARYKSLNVLTSMAESGALDPDMLAVLHRNFDDIDGSRRAEQENFATGQEWIAARMRGEPDENEDPEATSPLTD